MNIKRILIASVLFIFLLGACKLLSRDAPPEAAATEPPLALPTQGVIAAQPTATVEMLTLSSPTATAAAPAPTVEPPAILPTAEPPQAAVRLVYAEAISPYMEEYGVSMRIGVKYTAWERQTNTHTLLSQSPVSYSRDGRAVLVNSNGDLYLQDVPGLRISRLTETSGLLETGSWCPGAPDLISVSVIRPEECGEGCPSNPAVLNVHERVVRMVTEEADAWTWVAHTPDCAAFYYITSGPHLRMIRNGSVMEYKMSEYGLPADEFWADGPVLSPDGRYLAMMATSPKGVSAVVLDLAKTTSSRTATYENYGRGGWFSGPFWSPDGKYLAILLDNLIVNQNGVYVARIENGEVVEQTSLGGSHEPVWSPDSRSLIIDHDLVTVGTWEREPLAFPAEAWAVSWLTQAEYSRLASAQQDLNACSGAPAQRLAVGSQGTVCTKSAAVFVRSGPGRSNPMLQKLPVGSTVQVLAGPLCSDDWSWWEVSAGEGIRGWVAEGGDAEDPYFLCPAQ